MRPKKIFRGGRRGRGHELKVARVLEHVCREKRKEEGEVGERSTWVKSQGIFFRSTIQIHVISHLLQVGFSIVGFIAVVGGGVIHCSAADLY